MVEISDAVLIATGLSKEFILKELKVNETLNKLTEMPVSYAVFGGTAINKCYIGQKRFSEDIDLFIYGATEKKFAELAKKTFPEISKPKRMFRETYRYWIPYNFEERGVKGTVRLDANLNFSRPQSEIVEKEPGSFLNAHGFFIRNRDVKTFTKTALIASKLAAVATRSAPRDFFDLHHLLAQEMPERTSVMKEAYANRKAFFDFLPFNENFLQQAAEKIVSADANELAVADNYILKQNRPDWRELTKTLAFKVRELDAQKQA